ncbi:ABC transporter substrate-binding protein [Actinoplanes sp. NPDC049596]|uniref:ABC transporter substrate-binding protein n=1 Tax=unclassified Actinoplanes TaxID=2626549 RepID=UPI003430DCCE
MTGRDLFAIVVHGARTSLLVGVAATAIAVLVGTLVGIAAGFFGGWFDRVLSRITDVLLGFPWLVFAIALGAIVPVKFPKQLLLILVIGLFGWPGIARVVRGQTWDAKTDTVRTAGPDQVVFQLGQDATVAAQRLIADAGDDKNAFGAGFVPPAQLAQIQANASAKQRLVTSDAGALAYLALNTTRGPLKDVKVRQAIEYAVDKKAYQVASGGATGGDLATTLITPGVAGRQEYDLYQADPSGDVAKAKQLLTEAGQTNLNLTLLSENDQVSLAKAQAIQQGLQRAGIKVTIKPAEETTVTDTITGDKPDFDLTLSSWQPDFPSANGNIQPLFESKEIGGGGYNISRYSQPEVDQLIEQALAETDQAKAQTLWAQADKRILQDAPVVPLTYTKNSFLHGSNVQNFFVAAFPAYPNYLKVSLKQ